MCCLCSAGAGEGAVRAAAPHRRGRQAGSPPRGPDGARLADIPNRALEALDRRQAHHGEGRVCAWECMWTCRSVCGRVGVYVRRVGVNVDV
jgi:hypothetical protein